MGQGGVSCTNTYVYSLSTLPPSHLLVGALLPLCDPVTRPYPTQSPLGRPEPLDENSDVPESSWSQVVTTRLFDYELKLFRPRSKSRDRSFTQFFVLESLLPSPTVIEMGTVIMGRLSFVTEVGRKDGPKSSRLKRQMSINLFFSYFVVHPLSEHCKMKNFMSIFLALFPFFFCDLHVCGLISHRPVYTHPSSVKGNEKKEVSS